MVAIGYAHDTYPQAGMQAGWHRQLVNLSAEDREMSTYGPPRLQEVSAI
jgi:hypothetical protein